MDECSSKRVEGPVNHSMRSSRKRWSPSGLPARGPYIGSSRRYGSGGYCYTVLLHVHTRATDQASSAARACIVKSVQSRPPTVSFGASCNGRPVTVAMYMSYTHIHAHTRTYTSHACACSACTPTRCVLPRVRLNTTHTNRTSLSRRTHVE